MHVEEFKFPGKWGAGTSYFTCPIRISSNQDAPSGRYFKRDADKSKRDVEAGFEFRAELSKDRG